MKMSVDDRNSGTAPDLPPLKIVLSTLSKRWAIPTLIAISEDYGRFNALQRQLTGISHKMLIETLRVLQRDGFVSGPLTAELDDKQAMTQYRLTTMGSDFLELIQHIRQWAQDTELQLTRARREFERRVVRPRAAAPQSSPARVGAVIAMDDPGNRRRNGLA